MDLSLREGRVLYGLVRWPGLSDREVGERVGVVRSTVTVIRNRFLDSGLLSSFFVPDFGHLGCEILTTLYGEFTGGVKHDVDVFRQAVRDGVSTVFYMLSSGGLHLSFGASRNLTQVRQHMRNHLDLHHNSGYLTDKRHNYVLFPLKLSHVHRFFDYAPLLASHFGIDHEDEESNITEGLNWSPTDKERNVFSHIVSNPNSSDSEIARNSGVSRPTVTVLKNKFIENHIIKPITIPDLKHLGYEILAFTHLHMNPHHKHGKIKKSAQKVIDDPAHILKISGDLESVMLSAYRDYAGFKDSHDRMMSIYETNKMVIEKPVTAIFPLDNTLHITNHDYSRLTNSVLG